MVSPWLENSNVIHYTTVVDPHANRLKLLEEAADGLLYLHGYAPPIVHGDLKCANILVNDDGSACLADFGLSRTHEEVTSLSLRDAGSQRYMAPELFEGPENESVPLKTLASDIYAFGQVTLELLSGEKPFYRLRHEGMIYLAISRGDRPTRPDNAVSKVWLTDPVWNFIQQLTDVVRERRPSILEVLQAIQALQVLHAPEGFGAHSASISNRVSQKAEDML